ncbi:cyanophycinase [Chitinophaga japonensis]|uniref:Cyanophycinase n=1 Tax=Chitinophaga japonensis TaxID=104662 RepID=A0A562TGK6_CHIJA|nr:Type 1 glutamine amidotransferase-like domain-containing protein [Chitinophaga japonensis]TWI92176.1 cyanophycinase [Chitinophaga japonensis]
MLYKKPLSIFLLFCIYDFLSPQPALSQTQGTQIITSGGKASEQLFIELIGGPDANVVFIPTAASSLRSDSGIIWNPDKDANKKEFKDALLKRFKLNDLTILHTRDRQEANREAFIAALRKAKAVWISGGNAGRFTAAYIGTKVEEELKALLKRGGIIAGESAGAIVQGSYTIRGNPNKPVLMVKGSEKGLCLLDKVAINPHLSSAKRENELVTIIDTYPYLLGIGIDDDTGLIIKDGVGEVFGSGKIAIYDNKRHKEGWYYWLKAGDKFDFKNRVPVNIVPE